ncbi:uncharacterized protein EV420DRAFT_121517 [Desarmillaria tabescens]|uniref:Uncharacterized protein n=1 Tax=Armillaria tabescens TaxID=1929756 RepID=A0AA39N9T6_ARMTA|nr:uncharacterized protein EV420DRAFT_121517 [Desarmillaria tabescens]KAK0461677.1 hypothetical protein EV420DRAFT_121517 [Desarmillaria tabescens]
MDDVGPKTSFPASIFYVMLFDILQGLLFSLLLLVLLTAQFSSAVKRSKTWFVFIGSIVGWCASYLLLFGHQIGDGPPVGLCAFQAAVIYSTNPFGPSAALALELELFINLKALVNQTGGLGVKGVWGLVLFPLLVYCIMLAWVITVGLSHPNLLEREPAHMFCHIRSPTDSEGISLAQPSVVSAALAMLHKRKVGASQSTSTASLLSTSDLIRRNSFVTALTVFGVVMAITSYSQLSEANPVWNLALAGVPIVTFFLFGTHMDFIRVWFCLSASSNRTTAQLPAREPAIPLFRIHSQEILADRSH